MEPSATELSFGRFELNPARRELRMDGQPVALGARAFDVLQSLVEHRTRVVTKNELLDFVWPGVIVEENNVQVQISTLRRILGSNTIATIPGRGYRFTAAVEGPLHRGGDASRVPAGASSTDVAPRTNLPQDIPRLYGRASDVAAACSLVDAHRLVTIVGAGGIGKSRLAQAVALERCEHFEDGAWMIELAGLSDPDLVANAIAQPLHVAITAKREAEDELIAGIGEREMLLVLDNCEHLLDAVSSLVQALLKHVPQVKILATSQEPLRLPMEQQYRLSPLAVPAATTMAGAREFGALVLFEARVRAAQPRFALDADNLGHAIDICRRLDGLPLAIELAAARVATIGAKAVRDKLDARFRLLTGGARTTLQRHQTLRAAFEWSHNLLSDDEQRVFRRLAIFSGGFTVETAQAVATDERLDEWAVLDHLSALVEKSLVVVEGGDVPRYRLLESARAFGLEKLAAAEREAAVTLERHAQAMRRFLERVDDENLEGSLRSDQYAALVLPELDNLRAAFAWASAECGDRDTALAIAAHSGSLIDYANECVDWLLSVEPPNEGRTPPALRARYWRAIAATNMLGHVPVALQIESGLRACALYEQLGRPRRVFSSLIHVVRRVRNEDLGKAQAIANEARRLIQPDWPAEFRLLLLRLDAQFARMEQGFDAALALHREEVRIADGSRDWRMQVIARTNLIDILWHMGSFEEAAREVRDLVDGLRTRSAADTDMATAYSNAIGVLSEMGRIDEATRVAACGLPSMRRASEYYLEEWIHLFWRRGQLDVAARLIGALEARRPQVGASQINEQRLVDTARAGIEAALSAHAFAGYMRAGAALGKAEIHALLAESLVTPQRRGVSDMPS